MFANVGAYSKKAFSAVMAVLLAALLVPAVPVERALAAGGSEAQRDFIPEAGAHGLVSSGVLNNHAGASVTFDQGYTAEEIAAAMGQDKLDALEPAELVPGDVTLKDEAQKAALDAVGKAAGDAAKAAAEGDLAAKKDGWTANAETAAQEKALEDFATSKEQALEEAKNDAVEKLKAIDPDAVLTEGSVKLNKKADGTLAATPKLGNVVWATKDVKSQADPDSVVAAADTEKVAWEFGELALGFGTVASSNPAVAKDVTEGSGAMRTIEVLSSGETVLSVPFTYSKFVSEAPFTYEYAYQYGYTPHYSYPDCVFDYEYSYEYTDETGASNSVDKETVQSVKIGSIPEGDLSAEESIEGPSGTGEGTFSCRYNPLEGAEPLESTFDYRLAVRDLFSDAALQPVKHAFEGEAADGSQLYAFTYHDEQRTIDAFDASGFADIAAALAVLGEPKGISETNGFSVSYDAAAGKLTVKPLNATSAEGEDVSVTWMLPDGTEVVHTVHAMVNPFAIDGERFSLDSQPFRLKADNEAAVLADANEHVLAAVRDATGDVLSPLYGAATLTGYNEKGAASIPEVSLDRRTDLTEEEAAAWANYKVTEPDTVRIEAMRSVPWGDVSAESPEAGLALAASQGVIAPSVSLTAGNWESVWVNSEPQAQWNGFGLAYGMTEVPVDVGAFASTQVFDKGDGVHSVQLYAISEGEVEGRFAEKEIVEITQMAYQLDMTKPVITGDALVSSPERSKTFEGIFFGDSQVDVQVPIVDEPGKDAAGAVATKVSGMRNVDIEYADVEKGDHATFPSVAPDGPLYGFSLKGDQDVPRENIRVVADDNAGNRLDTNASDNKGIPTEYVRLVSDAAAPEISVAWDTYNAQNGRYYNTNRTMTITIEESFFNYVVDHQNDQVVAVVSQNGQQAISVHPSDFAEVRPNVWQYTLAFTVDANWDVTAPTVYDIVGRGASAAGDSFTIDKTNPTMEVSFDNNDVRNGMYYNAARTATITVTEHNFSGGLVNVSPSASAGNGDAVGSPSVSGWSDGGDVHTATVTFPGEGVYSMTIDGMDLATNALSGYSCPEFIVDTVKPQIEIGGVDNLQAYRESAQPQVSVHDANLDPSTTTVIDKISYPLTSDDANPYAAQPSVTATDLTVGYADPTVEPGNDGVYTLRVEAVDMAGNTDSQAMSWSVNRFGSTYVVGEATTRMLNEYLQGSKTQDVVVTEINPSGLDDAKTAVELTKDTNNKTLAPNEHYRLTADDASGWHSYTYTVMKSNFMSDGAYRVLFHSEDAAGNASENTMDNKSKDRSEKAEVAFAVDNTAPTCGFVNLDSDAVYEEAGHKGQVTINDNLVLERAEIKVNGTTFRELDAAELGNGGAFDVELGESSDTQQVSVVAYDAAGNKSEDLVASGIMVNSDPLVLWMHNTPLFVGSIVGGMAILALVAVGATVLVRKKSASKAGGAKLV